MKEDDKNKFYFKGRYFDKEEAFWEFVAQWPKQQVMYETFTAEWKLLVDDLWTNLILHRKELTNGQLNQIINETFFEVLKKLFKDETKQS